MPRFGIAIPFYRNVSYLRTAIESVREQDDADWQLWVVDDCGEPEIADEVKELTRSFEDSRVRYERNRSTLGMVGNWNRCLDLADTDLVTLLHADDRLLPSYLSTLRSLTDAHPEAVAGYCGAQIIDATGSPAFSLADAVKPLLVPRGGHETRLHGESGATALMRGNFIMCPTLCFRRERLGERRFDPRWEQVQDLELTVRLLMEAEMIVGTAQVAYAYRRHEDSATTVQSRNRLRFDEEFRLFDQVAEKADALGWATTARVSRHKRVVKLHLLYRALRDALALRFGAAGETLRYLASRMR